jgi:hypothetical protein
MAQLILTIPDNKLQKVIDAFADVHEIPYTIENDKPPFEKKRDFTKSAWLKERVSRFIIDTVEEYERKTKIKDAEKSVTKDKSLVS